MPKMVAIFTSADARCGIFGQIDLASNTEELENKS